MGGASRAWAGSYSSRTDAATSANRDQRQQAQAESQAARAGAADRATLALRRLAALRFVLGGAGVLGAARVLGGRANLHVDDLVTLVASTLVIDLDHRALGRDVLAGIGHAVAATDHLA